MPFDANRVKLGRRGIRHDPRRLKLCKYLSPLPAPPPSCDWTRGVTSFGEMLNDKLGCCTIAGIGHAIQTWTLNTDGILTVPDSTIEQYYQKWDGYNPADPSTDQGGIEADVLTKWRNETFDGHKLLAFTDAEPMNLVDVREAISLFGGVYIGVSLPNVCFSQPVWDVVSNDGGPAGGHCVWVPAYTPDSFTCVTWGKTQVMTVDFWKKYVDEVHPLLSFDWIEKTGLSPSRFNLVDLNNDLYAIK